MTREQKLQFFARMLDDESEEEDILGVFLDLAAGKILNRMYPFKTDYTGLEVPSRYDMIQLNVACYLYNKRGAEGEVQHIENGIHRNWGSSDVPDGMLKDIVPFSQAIR